MVVEPLLEHVGPFFLVFARCSGLFALVPVLGSSTFPIRAKALLAAALAVAIYPVLGTERQVAPDVDLFGLIPLVISEMLIGLSMGLIATIPLIAVQMGGQLMGYQMGLSVAQAYNPELDTSMDVIGQLMFFLSMSLFIAAWGLDALFLSLTNSFERVPVGGFRSGWAPVELIVGVLSSGFELALRVSTPVVAMTIVVMLAMGFIMKTMPQVNVLTIGFALKILVGVFILAMAVAAVGHAGGEEIEAVLREIMRWSSSPAADGGAPLEIVDEMRGN